MPSSAGPGTANSADRVKRRAPAGIRGSPSFLSPRLAWCGGRAFRGKAAVGGAGNIADRLQAWEVEFAVPGPRQERLPLSARVDVSSLAAVLGVTYRDASTRQVRDLHAVAHGAGTALEPAQVAQIGFHCFP